MWILVCKRELKVGLQGKYQSFIIEVGLLRALASRAESEVEQWDQVVAVEGSGSIAMVHFPWIK